MITTNKTMYLDINKQSDIEVFVDAVGDINVEITAECSYGRSEETTVISIETLKQVIYDLTAIYEDIK